ncbi:hypothetical protein ACHAPU_009127 [Fusarium lateritium]
MHRLQPLLLYRPSHKLNPSINPAAAPSASAHGHQRSHSIPGPKTLESITNTIADRLALLPDAHPLDTEAVVCGHSQESLMLLNSLIKAYGIKATALWESSVQDIGVTANLDLEHPLSQLYGSWLKLDIGPATQHLMPSYKHHFKWLAPYQLSNWLLQQCATPQYAAHDYILKPFYVLATLDLSEYMSHDALVDSPRQSLTSWFLEAEGRRMRQSQFHTDLTDWSEVYEVFRLAYYITGFHALSSHVVHVAHEVTACQAE